MVRGALPAALTTALAVCVFTLAAPTKIAAEVRVGAHVQLYNSVMLGAEPLGLAGLATANVEFAAQGERNVRSRVVLRGTLFAHEQQAAARLEIPRAEVRWRFFVTDSYDMRLTAGRTRLSWGDGALYKAGDVINGAAPQQLDFTARALRDESAWLLALYMPLGTFAFFEPVLLLPMFDLSVTTQNLGPAGATDTPAQPSTPTVWQAGAGGRFHFDLWGLKTELGYLYRGSAGTHTPYLSLHGHLLVDLYASFAYELRPLDNTTHAAALASAGALYSNNHPRLGTWSLRAEMLWSERDGDLKLYPELMWAPSQLFSLFVRAQIFLRHERRWISAHSLTSVSTAGFSWSPVNGLSLSLFGTAASGAAQTSAHWATITAAVAYIF